MPVKRRLAKRKNDPAAELEAWSMTFQSGYDFFSQLKPYGFSRSHPGHDTDNVRKAAREAWHRLGEQYMKTWVPGELGGRELPWAYKKFGAP
jgi:hypothetical protein